MNNILTDLFDKDFVLENLKEISKCKLGTCSEVFYDFRDFSRFSRFFSILEFFQDFLVFFTSFEVFQVLRIFYVFSEFSRFFTIFELKNLLFFCQTVTNQITGKWSLLSIYPNVFFLRIFGIRKRLFCKVVNIIYGCFDIRE